MNKISEMFCDYLQIFSVATGEWMFEAARAEPRDRYVGALH